MRGFQDLDLSADDCRSLFEACFDRSFNDKNADEQVLDDLLRIYNKQLEQLDLEYGKGGERWFFATRSHDQVHGAITAIRNAGSSITRTEARKVVEEHFKLIISDRGFLDSLIDAALRIWLLINFRPIHNSSVGYGRPCILWAEDERLESCLERIFERSATELTLSQRRLSPAFTVANMVNICGLQVRWATTLDDHLNLDRERKVLWVFPFRAWLHLHSKRGEKPTSGSSPQNGDLTVSAPLDQAVYDEAERTMDLLFPSWDKDTQKYLRKQQRQQISWYTQNRELDLKAYHVWRDRLLDLNEVVFLAPPEGWAQLWNDRRDPQKFWTFWIALVILWLTIVSTVAAVLQTWATLKGT